MSHKLQQRFLANYLLMFFLSIIIGLMGYLLLLFANDVLSKTLVKSRYTAESLMKDDFHAIDFSGVVENGGGVQVVNQDLQVVLTEGLDLLESKNLTQVEWTHFLTGSRQIRLPYSVSVAYNETHAFWLVVSFPTSLRIDFAIVHNSLYPSKDLNAVIGVLAAVAILYFLLLTVVAAIYSRITALSILNPLRKLCLSTRRLRDGDYTTRVDLNLKNEFKELQDTFNSMAEKLQQEAALREQMELNRRRMILDISHDLKNPLAAMMGHAEYCLAIDTPPSEEIKNSLRIICDHGKRANLLISGLFELSKLESPDYRLPTVKTDISEFLRQTAAQAVLSLEAAGFSYVFEIPEEELWVQMDTAAMSRVFQNLLSNAIAYNSKGTSVMIELTQTPTEVICSFSDNGTGIDKEVADRIFQPFVRADAARNSKTGGTGLGLAIVQKIIALHGGSIRLDTAPGKGCSFTITLPKI